MPGNNPTNTSLDVRDSGSSGDGWIDVAGSNGAPYSYKYTGGNTGNNGALSFSVGGGHAAVNLTLAADPRYTIQSVAFTGDDAQQLTVQGNAPHNRVINDRCSEAIDAQYKVTVLDTVANATVPCDPVIRNVPGQ
jgi:hypothetical protein